MSICKPCILSCKLVTYFVQPKSSDKELICYNIYMFICYNAVILIYSLHRHSNLVI